MPANLANQYASQSSGPPGCRPVILVSAEQGSIKELLKAGAPD